MPLTHGTKSVARNDTLVCRECALWLRRSTALQLSDDDAAAFSQTAWACASTTARCCLLHSTLCSAPMRSSGQ